ncbi:MAG TPA: phosphotransferase [Actinocrinis sp.]|nr:phosphotransferase [Actinocrinis sp.]
MSHLVHGMGTENVAPDWPAITLTEADALLCRYPRLGSAARLAWISPRPLSAAAVVETAGGDRVFVKRHHVSVRSVAGLLEEHRFLEHLASRGAPVVTVLTDADGASVVADGHWTYEVHTAGRGRDLYRDAISWSPFTTLGHARAAGRALAELHEAARGYDAPARTPQPLVAGFHVFGSDDPFAALEAYASARPHVAAELARRPWRSDFEHWHLPFHERLRPLLAGLEPLWTHNDLHASNLLWEGGSVATVIDFSLTDRAFAVHDLAVAIERNAVEWLELDAPHGAGAGAEDAIRTDPVHVDAALALIEGYGEVRKLADAERAALPDLLALCHADYALSEIDYFRGVTGSAPNTELAYRYLVDHTAWFAGPAGARFLDRLRAALAA